MNGARDAVGTSAGAPGTVEADGRRPAHRQAGIPRELADAVDDLLRAQPWLGHRSLSGFATEAVRRMLVEAHRDVQRRDLMAAAGLERRREVRGPLSEPDGAARR